MNRKRGATVMAILVILAGVTAEAAAQAPKERFSVTWGAGIDGQPDVSSRTSEIGFGFVVFRNETLDIRNQLLFSNGVMIREDTGERLYKKTLTDKISVGMMTRGNLFRPYGFVDVRAGTCGTELWDTFANPMIWNIGAGTGLDIFATKNWSFFLEIGFLGNIYEGEFIPQQRFELGVMVHF